MEKQIFDLFLFNNKLKFNEIEKIIKTRSNKLAYHLKLLVNKGVLIKEGEYYSLSETSENIIPYFSEKKAVMSIIIVHIGNKKEAFFYRREKRPFKGYFSLPGGRLVVGETIPQATKRIMKEKFNINAKFQKINSVSLEHVRKNGKDKIVHSFLLIFVSATSKDKISLTEIKKNKNKMIVSDYQLITKDYNKEVKIRQIFSRD